MLSDIADYVAFEKIAKIQSGKRPSIVSENLHIPVVGASAIMGYTNEANFSSPTLIIGRVGTHGVVQFFYSPIWASDNTLVIESDYFSYCYHLLKSFDYNALNKGSTQPLITQGDIKAQVVPFPTKEQLAMFERMNPLNYIEKLRIKNLKLAELKSAYLKKFFA